MSFPPERGAILKNRVEPAVHRVFQTIEQNNSPIWRIYVCRAAGSFVRSHPTSWLYSFYQHGLRPSVMEQLIDFDGQKSGNRCSCKAERPVRITVPTESAR